MKIRRGQVVLVNLEPVIGSEQGRTRPAVVIQNDIGNEYSPVTIVAPITSKVFSKEFPTNVKISGKESGLGRDSTILCNQIRTVDKARIVKTLSKLDSITTHKLNLSLKTSLALD